MMIKIIPPSSKRIHFKKNSIHYTLKFFFIILLCAGFLPVEGIFSSSEDLRFTWFSCLVIYSLYVFTLASAMCIFQLYHYFASSSDDVTLREIIFICTAIQASIFFIQLASKWPKLIQKWCKLDEKFNTVYGYPKLLKLKLILVTAIYIILVLGEYFFYATAKFTDSYTGRNVTFQKGVEQIYFYIFTHVPYHILLVLIFLLPSISTFMALSLIDIFVILISMAVSYRFQQINETLQQYKTKNSSINFWMTLRRNYSEMGNLCSDLNDKIANIVVLSYGSNMILLITELRTLISNDVTQQNVVFSVYSFTFLIVRLVAVYFFSSRINAESRKPVRILFSVSSETYNVEIRRWYMQMKLDSVALTGNTLFKITPGLILSIAGAIVTYELIFIQFTQPK
ncbi:gustatory receptor for sugar taste 64a-like [Tenebrio molitor]|uniref:gustatory receptor for sugar taste 64a-like n=1 Tax=Tenebrio molitor TaxID=7067 RepID=UPI0036249A63